METDNRTKGLFRFRYSLGLLLFVTLCVCGYFGGYRAGFDAGKHEGSRPEMVAISYNVSDLIAPTSGPDTAQARQVLGDRLVDQIKRVAPGDWSQDLGADIQWTESNQFLTINQSQEVHGRIVELLNTLRAHTIMPVHGTLQIDR